MPEDWWPLRHHRHHGGDGGDAGNGSQDDDEEYVATIVITGADGNVRAVRDAVFKVRRA